MELLSFVTLALLALSSSALQYRGADISSLIIVEQSGVKYKDQLGIPQKFETIMTENGENAARVRVWTSGQYNLTYALEMGKRIKNAGMTLMVDLHYSDTWADAGHQATPAGWPSDVPGLTAMIGSYTGSVVTAFAKQGTPIDVLQIGNEINSGLLWPTGINYVAPDGWINCAGYLHSARLGAAAAGFKGKTMIHLANGWDEGDMTWWWSNAIAQGTFSLADVDYMGFSFYPFYGTTATLSALSTSLTTLATTYNKDIMVAETDWPATSCAGTQLSANFSQNVAGQLEWSAAIQGVLEKLPNNLGKGILYWEPGWIGNAGLGSSCPDNLLFTPDGTARLSVDMFWVMAL